MPATYEPIATTTASGSQTTITLSSIPATYTDLKLVVDGTVATNDFVYIRLNSDTGSNYSTTWIIGDGSTASSLRQTAADKIYTDFYVTSTGRSVMVAEFNNYSNTTTYKTVLMRSNNASNRVSLACGLWRNTAAITSITVYSTTGYNFSSSTTFTLYGIKAA